ncbi:hypothetical protein [Martelella sp. HB161492]|uniref:hypothetical protein n=1 Tax=Martelella sp. HB161492 TaxID=2720726 RepID=UPI0015903509|nr:hypothetical protein [Martelella sp. HB161492]
MQLSFETIALSVTAICSAIAATGTIWQAITTHRSAQRQRPSLLADFRPFDGHPGWVHVRIWKSGEKQLPFSLASARLMKPRGSQGLRLSATQGEPQSVNHHIPAIAPSLKQAQRGDTPLEPVSYAFGYEELFRFESLFYHQAFRNSLPPLLDICVTWQWADQPRHNRKISVTARQSKMND